MSRFNLALHGRWLSFFKLWCFCIFFGLILDLRANASEQKKVECPTEKYDPPQIERSSVYKDVPFKAGEMAEYEMRYMGALAGYGKLEVRAPEKFRDRWHRVFHADARTGDWYKMIFVGHDKITAVSQPWDFGIAKFYMEQDEGHIFGKRFLQKKWLEFDHEGCKVQEKTWTPKKGDVLGSFDLARGALDSFGAVYFIRSRTFVIGEKQRALVYTSEKNWWLEMEPVAHESMEVPAGKYAKTTKLRLQTYIGKELQQKGDFFVWVDESTPSKPIVAIQAEIKLGSFWLKLNKFSPGQ